MEPPEWGDDSHLLFFYCTTLILNKSDTLQVKSPHYCNTNRLMLYWVTIKPPKGIQMKHILILISFLLLSSPLFGQSKKSGLLYIMENGSRYVGEWEDGKKHGQGTYTSGKGEREGDKYVGEFKGGFKNGHGKYIWSDGDEYVGEFKDDKPNGQGTYTWSNGDKYVGEFKDGKKHGQGTWTSTDGEKYSGEWKDGKKYDQGTYTSQDGTKGKYGNFTGKYVNGIKQ